MDRALQSGEHLEANFLLLNAAGRREADDPWRKSAAYWAARGGSIECMELLKQNIENHLEVLQAALSGAAAADDESTGLQTLEWLSYHMEYLKTSQQPSLWSAAVKVAIDARHNNAVEYLLTKIPESMLCVRDLKTAGKVPTEFAAEVVGFAASYGSLETLEYLIENDLCTGWAFRKGMVSPLVSAAEHGNVDALKLLLIHDKTSAVTRKDKGPALIIAAHKGQVEALEFLLKNSGMESVNVKNLIKNIDGVINTADPDLRERLQNIRGILSKQSIPMMNSLTGRNFLIEQGNSAQPPEDGRPRGWKRFTALFRRR